MARLRQTVIRSPALVPAGLVVALLVALAGRYGPHRDELYFLALGDRLAWGYPDQGPLTPALARAMDSLSPGSLTLLRLPSALAAGATVLITGRLARELGGGPRSEALAAACAAVGVIFLQVGHLLSTTTADLLAWTAITWIAVRAVRRGQDRLWPLAGLVLGFALLNKPLPAFLAAGLAAGVLISGPRRLLRSPWVWAGAGIALLMWLPWLAWQAERSWPQLEVSSAIAEGGSTTSEPRWAFLPFQLLLVSPFLAPIWVAGLVRLFRDPELRELRFLAWAWVLLAAVFIVSGGKPYYLAGLFPVLLAAGAGQAEEWLGAGRRRRRKALLAGALSVSAVAGPVIALPLLPLDKAGAVVAVNPDVGETVGWPELARTVAAVRARVPGGGRAVLLARNYGEAGALDRYGPVLGLPPAYSGHNGYADLRVPPGDRSPVVAVGFARGGQLERDFHRCVIRARIRSPHDIDNEENGAPVWVCAAPREPWSELWPRLRRLG